MNILVTGSNGFIGKYISEFLEKHHKIIGVGTKNESEAVLSGYVKWNLGHEEIPIELLKQKIDAIVHIASYISVDDYDVELSYSNILGTHRLLNLCNQLECSIFILYSGIPIVDVPEYKSIHEKDFVNPKTMYHATKAMQEYMVNQLEKKGVRTVSLRIPSPIAPIMKKQTIFSIFCNRALKGENIIINGKGTRKQNYIDVRDIASVTESVLNSENARGVYNIGSETTVSNYELAEKCIMIAGNSKSKIVFSGKPDATDNQEWNIDLNKIKKDVGYKQVYSIEQTITDYMKQYRKTNAL